MKPVPTLPETPTLADLQSHLRETCVYHGWDKNTVEHIYLLFVEEVGELAKAVRKMSGLQVEVGLDRSAEAMRANMEEELADVLCYLLDIANHYNVDLEAAYRAKTERNLTRQWLTTVGA